MKRPLALEVALVVAILFWSRSEPDANLGAPPQIPAEEAPVRFDPPPPATLPATLPAAPETVTETLQPPSSTADATVNVLVLDAGDRTPIAGAEVAIFSSAGDVPPRQIGVSDRDGVARLTFQEGIDVRKVQVATSESHAAALL